MSPNTKTDHRNILRKKKNQFRSCTKVSISFDGDGKTGAISNKHRIKNARNEEKVSAHTGLYPQGELLG